MDYVTSLCVLYEIVNNDYFRGLELIENAEVFEKLKVGLTEWKEDLSAASRTAIFCIQYMQYVEIVKDFMHAANC